jgi:hypothetical protein
MTMTTGNYTPEALDLERRIQAAGAKVEKFQNAGKSVLAREAFHEVKRLVALRTPETVEAMERERDLQQLDRIEEQREAAHQESLREL